MVYYPPQQLGTPPENVVFQPPDRNRAKKPIWIFLVILLIIILFLGYFFYKLGLTYSKISSGERSFYEFLIDVLPVNSALKDKLLNRTAPVKKDVSRTNILILGIRGEDDENGGLLTDAIILLSFRKDAGKAALISIPRDLYVDIEDRNKKEKINAVYELGQGKIGFVKKVFERVAGVSIDNVVAVDFTAFKELIDILGGVTIYLEKPFVEDRQWGDQVFSLPAGRNKLNGERSLIYVRSRFTTSDFDRSKRQQDLLLAIKDRVSELGLIGNAFKIFSIIDTVGRNVKTDLGLSDLEDLLKIYKKFDSAPPIRRVLSSEKNNLLYSAYINNEYVLLPLNNDYGKIRDFIINVFNQ